MKAKFQKGSAFLEGIVALAVLFVILLTSHPHPAPGPTTQYSSSSITLSGSSAPQTTSATIVISPYNNIVSLGTGSAAYSTQVYNEYVTITNISQSPIDISGWRLENGKGTRSYNVGGNVVQFPSDSALIPKVDEQDIILKPYDIAYVTTGSISNTSPFMVESFKDNECSSYIQNTLGYQQAFVPSLSNSCVAPSEEPGVSSLDVECQNFIQTMPACQTPKFNTVDSSSNNYMTDLRGHTCVGCVNGVAGLSNECVAFIKAHFNYQGCLTYHSSDANFYGNDWRIYLNRPYKMYAPKYETISLYDSLGRLVAKQSY